ALEFGLGDESGLPSIRSDFSITWDGTAGFDDLSTATLKFANVQMDVGSYISRVLGPALRDINRAIEPIRPLLELLGTPVPLISDLSGQPVTLIDLALLVTQLGLGEGPDVETIERTREFIRIATLVSDLVETGA